MTSQENTYRRILRRETHSSRSNLAVTLAILLTLLSAWVVVETILELLRRPALLVAPTDAATAIVRLGNDPEWALIGGGIIVGIFGLVLLVSSMASGRRPRHTLPSERAAVVADDEVIASALARQACYAGNVAPDNVSVSVGNRVATILLRASSGQAVDTAAVKTAVGMELAEWAIRPPVTPRVKIDRRAEVGA